MDEKESDGVEGFENILKTRDMNVSKDESNLDNKNVTKSPGSPIKKSIPKVSIFIHYLVMIDKFL